MKVLFPINIRDAYAPFSVKIRCSLFLKIYVISKQIISLIGYRTEFYWYYNYNYEVGEFENKESYKQRTMAPICVHTRILEY